MNFVSATAPRASDPPILHSSTPLGTNRNQAFRSLNSLIRKPPIGVNRLHTHIPRSLDFHDQSIC
jgi:hypothetical protein